MRRGPQVRVWAAGRVAMEARVPEHVRCTSSGPSTCQHRLSVLHQTWEVSYHFCSEEEGLQAQGVEATSPRSPANEDGGRAAAASTGMGC